MSQKPNITLDNATVKAVECIVNRGDRAEIVPVKDGVKVLRVRREAVKTGHKEGCPKC